jgi:hypothetical protein
MIDFKTCKFLVWGYKNVYHTHGHIHEGFYRALKLSGKDVNWFDQADDISQLDLSNTFVITNHDCIPENGYWPWSTPKVSKIPIRDDCFYAVHGLNDHSEIVEIFANRKNALSWNVLTMSEMRKSLGLSTREPMQNEIMLAEDAPFDESQKHLEFRWATDLLPHEIELNKPTTMLSLRNPIINWVGTVWHVNQVELGEFMRACKEDGIAFNHIGGGQRGVVTIEENIKLVRESYMAPAISGSHHLTEGYAPCRIFKNISYGQFGITNSKQVNQIFGEKLIFNPDPYKLYFEAKERLQSIHISDLHSLMDEVAQKHTYLNRIDVLVKAANIVLANGK